MQQRAVRPALAVPLRRRRAGSDAVRGTLVTLREGIELNEKLGVRHTPELKSGDPERIKAIFGSQ